MTPMTLARKINQCDWDCCEIKVQIFFLFPTFETWEGDSNPDLERHQNEKSDPDRYQSDADPQNYIPKS
jgi:hypothetical protein